MTPLLLAVVLLMAFDAFAQGAVMVARSPFDPALIGVYGWVIGIAMLGGIANFARRVKAGQARAFNLFEFVGELIISGSAGLITYWFCKSVDINEWLTAAFVGIAGHMGSRIFFMGEQMLERSWKRVFGDEHGERGQ